MNPAEGDVPGLPADLPDPAVAPDLPEAPAGPGDAEAPAAVDPDAATQAPEVPLLTIRGGLPPVVADAAGVAELVTRFRSGSGPVAVDAERASGYRYSQRAYLIQLRREGVGSVLIDPIPLGSVPNLALAPLSSALCGRTVRRCPCRSTACP